VKRLALIAAVAVTASACGGGGASSLYTKAATVACLAKKGVRAQPVPSASDFVASTATGGAFRAVVPKNQVTVSFGDTSVDADNIEQAYHTFRAKNVGISDILRRQGNAIMLWRMHPQDADIATITDCLKS
jgi:hypothetical protein